MLLLHCLYICFFCFALFFLSYLVSSLLPGEEKHHAGFCNNMIPWLLTIHCGVLALIKLRVVKVAETYTSSHRVRCGVHLIQGLAKLQHNQWSLYYTSMSMGRSKKLRWIWIEAEVVISATLQYYFRHLKDPTSHLLPRQDTENLFSVMRCFVEHSVFERVVLGELQACCKMITDAWGLQGADGCFEIPCNMECTCTYMCTHISTCCCVLNFLV